MRAARLACLAALVELAWGSSDLFREEHTHESPEEIQSRTFPAPKAPPPTEVTHVFTTRSSGKISRPVMAPEVLARTLTAKLTEELNLRKRIARLEKAMRNRKKQTGTISNEQPVTVILVTLFMLALIGLSLLSIAEYRSSLPSADSIFPQSVQPEDVPKVFESLLLTRKTLVVLSDNCSTCLKGLKELKKQDKNATVVLLTGHRLEEAVRTHLKLRYKIFQLPAMFINGTSFTDFAAAVFIRRETCSTVPAGTALKLRKSSKLNQWNLRFQSEMRNRERMLPLQPAQEGHRKILGPSVASN